MVPELSGLSQEEAALISDVLSQLALGGSSASPAPEGQATPLSALPDSELKELELAEQAIEQELRGLQSLSTLGQRANLPAGQTLGQRGTADTAGSNPQPSAPIPLASRPRAAAAVVGRDIFIASLDACPTTTDLLTVPRGPPSTSQASASPRQAFQQTTGARMSALTGNWVHGDCASSSQAITSHQGPSVALAAPSQPALREAPQQRSQQSLSALQSMREKLKQQQHSYERGYAGPADPPGPVSHASGLQAATAASSGCPTPATAERASYGYNRSSEPPARGSSASSAANSPAPRSRRSPIPAPNSAAAARAFTMLNARTNPERYGSDVGHAEAHATASAKKAPVKLPENERSARLQQLYERTWQWRQRCKERYAKEKQEREASELNSCTFSPQITAASQLIVQGKPPSEVYNELSLWSTPTKHRQDGASLSRGAVVDTVSPTATCNRTAPPMPAAAAPANPSSRQGDVGKASRGSPVTADAANGNAPVGACGPVSAASASPSPKAAMAGTPVGARLYQRAVEQRARLEERVAKQQEEEERARRFKASMQGVTPRLYNQQEPSTRHLPTGMEECTFHPRTRFHVMSSRALDDNDVALHSRFDNRSNGRGSAFRKPDSRGPESPGALSGSMCSSAGSFARPKSAPHFRAGSYRSPSASVRSVRHGDASPGKGRPPPSHTGTHVTMSISPELDWDEFLARQERFLADRQHKVQQLEQSGPTMPRMSPGSRRLLQERNLRESVPRSGDPVTEGADGEVETGNPGAPASPSRHDRRLRTVLEMYKECTFQPRITRKAAALPSRNVNDLMDGGRSRRDEWMEQQRALQQMREAEAATFKPQRQSNDLYSHVQPRLSLKNVDAYLTHEAHKQRQREALRAELESEREALELQHCTFKPQTTPLPSYLIRRLQEQHLLQLQAQQLEQPNPAFSWDSGNGMPIDGMQPVDAYYAQQDPPTGNVLRGSSGSCAGYPTEVDDSADQDADQAYQRALQYARAYGADV